MYEQAITDNSLLSATIALAMLSLLLLCLFYEARIYRVELRFAVNTAPRFSNDVPQIVIHKNNMLSANDAACQLLNLTTIDYPVVLDSLFTHTCIETLHHCIRRHQDFTLAVYTHDQRLIHLQANVFGKTTSARFHISLLDTDTSQNNPFFRRLHNNLETLSSPAIISDTNQNILATNSKFRQLSGFDTDDLYHRPVSQLRPGIFAESYYHDLWAQVCAAGHWAGQLWLRFNDGQSHLQQITISSVLNEHGQTTHYLIVASPAHIVSPPITGAKKIAPDTTLHLPQHDDLEQYFNALTVSADVIQIDICRFQLMRETFGDETASRFMNEYIERIRRILNEENYLAQIGKDEFLVVTKHHDPAYISSLAQKILCIGRTPIHCDGFDLLAPVNIGIAYYPDHGQNLTTLINATSAAVSSARTLGNNQFDIYQPEYSDSLKENMRLETLLRSAIGKNQLTLHYQPILNTQLQLEKVEALLRWTCAEKGPISPGIFIPIAEQSDLIYMIGHWVIKEACRQHALWRDSGLGNIKIAVNISSQQLKQQSLLTDIQEAIQSYNIDARYIELEITETTLMEQLEHGRSLLRELKAMGLSLALDDFGTGYSSLAYLSEFPLDTLKVDRSFVKNIENEEHALILDTIIRLAKSLTLNIVAEGVETEFQHQHLLERHCDFYQGFLFARPMPAIDIESNIQNKQLLLSVPAEQA